MKKLALVLLLLIILCGNSFGQDSNQVCIASVVPDQTDDMDARTLNMLQTRMESVTSQNGFSTTQNGSFVMYPVVNVLESEVIEGGLRNYFKQTVELSLFVCQETTRTGFGSHTVSLTGTGFTRNEALRNAFQKLNPSDPDIVRWLSKCREKIQEYYTSNCSQIIASAKVLGVAGKYDEALALLDTYPNTLEGYNKVVETQLQFYDKMAREQCSVLLARAESAISVQEYVEASQILADISFDSPCSSEAALLLNRLNTELKEAQEAEQRAAIEAEERERAERIHREDAERAERIHREDADREMEDRQNRREYQLERARIKAIHGIAVAYYKSRPKVTYNYYRFGY